MKDLQAFRTQARQGLNVSTVLHSTNSSCPIWEGCRRVGAKAALIPVLLGLTHVDAGRMSLLGFDVPRHRDAALARVAAIVDEPRFRGHLTGRQNLQLLRRRA